MSHEDDLLGPVLQAPAAAGGNGESAAAASARRAAEDAAAVEATAQQLTDVTVEANSLRQQLMEALGSNSTLQVQ